MKRLKNHIGIIALSIFIWIYSGSLFYMSANKNLQILIIPVALILFYNVCRSRGLKIFTKIKDTWSITFLYIYILSVLLNFAVASSLSQFGLYFLFEFLIMACAYFITTIIDYKKFIAFFIDAMTVIALISIVCWMMPEYIKSIAFYRYSTGTWTFASILVYNLNLAVPTRNCGPFWEPGLFQAFLNFALLLIVLSGKKRGNIIRVCVLTISVITTFSSTGYFLLFCVAMLKLLQSDVSKKRIIAIFAIIICGYMIISNISNLLAFIDQYTLYSVSSKFLDGGNVSVTTRLYSGFCDLRIAFTNPFGANRAILENLRQSYTAEYGTVSASTSTLTAIFTYFGWIVGMLFSFMWLRGCIRVQKNILNRLILVLFMVCILSTELHVELLFFNLILFYWNSSYATDAVKVMNESRSHRLYKSIIIKS